MQKNRRKQKKKWHDIHPSYSISFSNPTDIEALLPHKERTNNKKKQTDSKKTNTRNVYINKNWWENSNPLSMKIPSIEIVFVCVCACASMLIFENWKLNLSIPGYLYICFDSLCYSLSKFTFDSLFLRRRRTKARKRKKNVNWTVFCIILKPVFRRWQRCSEFSKTKIYIFICNYIHWETTPLSIGGHNVHINRSFWNLCFVNSVRENRGNSSFCCRIQRDCDECIRLLFADIISFI